MTDASRRDPPPDRNTRAAWIVFAALVVIAVPVVLFGLGSYHWFFRDDFIFLTDRRLTSLNDLFRPHDSHWSTVPVIAWRVLWAVFGIRSYLPYQATVLAMHLGACALLRVIMRRAGVSPWTATVVAAAFILFGPGEQDIIWAFQIGFTGSLTFGLAQLVLLDHDGPVDRRDALGLAAGVIALLSSGVGIAMAVVAGAAALGRRGWRVALLQSAPLGLLYIIWRQVEHPKLSSPFGRPSFAVLFRWVRSGEIGVFVAIGHFQVVAALLGIVFVVGLALAWTRLGRVALRRHASIPAAMVLGGVVFSTFTAIGRWWQGSDFARSSRYVHIGTALVLPAVAVAIDALVRRRRLVGIAALALVVVAVPWNATNFGRTTVFGASYMKSRKQILTNVVRLPEAREVPRDVRPIPDVFVGTDLTIGFLLDAQKSGRLKASTHPISDELRRQLVIRLGVAQRTRGTPTRCKEIAGARELVPKKGTTYGFTKLVLVSLRDANGKLSNPVSFNPLDGDALTIELSTLHLRFAPPRATKSFTLCSIG